MGEKIITKQLKNGSGKHLHSSQRKGRPLFTPGFFRFLFGLTLIIAFGIAALIYLGLANPAPTT